MAPNPFFSARIPPALLNRIEEYREHTNQTKTEVLICALAKYVDFELNQDLPLIPPIRQELDAMCDRLQDIEDTSKEIEFRLKKLEDLSEF